MILIPAWIIALLTALVAFDNFFRFRREKNLLLLGKVFAWGVVAVIYLCIALDLFDIETSRALSRWGWTLVPSTELAYRYAKIRWKI